eukprot:3754649-Pleurochrysis_carterae.AAC.1
MCLSTLGALWLRRSLLFVGENQTARASLDNRTYRRSPVSGPIERLFNRIYDVRRDAACQKHTFAIVRLTPERTCH